MLRCTTTFVFFLFLFVHYTFLHSNQNKYIYTYTDSRTYHRLYYLRIIYKSSLLRVQNVIINGIRLNKYYAYSFIVVYAIITHTETRRFNMSGVARRRITKQTEQTSNNNTSQGKGDYDWDGSSDEEKNSSQNKYETAEPRFTLMEEVMLLGLKDQAGYTSFWNDSISAGLRACVLVELALRGLITLEKKSLYSRTLVSRKVEPRNSTKKTNDVILDEALKHIRAGVTKESIEGWIGLLTGESWNPLCLQYQLRQTRERLAKGLVEKGVLTSQKTDFYLFNMTTHPLVDTRAKSELIRRIQSSVLEKWVNDVTKFDERTLALLFLANASDVLENAFEELNDQDHDTAWTRINQLLNLNCEDEAARKGASNEIVWAVAAYVATRIV